ncbi:MAG: septal ring lytic transglycosylase RlpA family protein [Cystobacter sp.]
MRRLLVGVCVGAGLLTGCAAKGTRGDEGPADRASATRGYLEEGLASYYADRYHGRPTASGEKLDQKKFTAAHPKLPFGTCLRVVNMENQRSVEVRVNDRGPYVKGRVVDVSLAAARRLDLVDKGLARVRLYRCDARGDTRTSQLSVPFASQAG